MVKRGIYMTTHNHSKSLLTDEDITTLPRWQTKLQGAVANHPEVYKK